MLKQPPGYSETIAYHAQQNLELPYHRPSPNPNTKPRWITVAGMNPSGAGVSCQLETSVHLTHSEPKIHYKAYTRSGSPLMSSPTTSYQVPIAGPSRLSPPYPIPQSGTNGCLYQKRYGQRLPHASAVRAISRVQSMPAHNSQQYLVDEEPSPQFPIESPVKDSQSSPGARFPVYSKQPPPYEHAVLQQARARYAQSVAGMCASHALGIPKDVISSSREQEEEMALNNRSCGQLASKSSSNSSIPQFAMPSTSNPLLSSVDAVVDRYDSLKTRLQRPSSCQELSSTVLVSSPPHSAPITYSSPTTYASPSTTGRSSAYLHEPYVMEHARPPSCCYYSPYAAGRNHIRAGRPIRDSEKTQKSGYTCPLIAVSEERMLL
ncbi:unnamed protein product [Gongylonema pulchrum]|uniref:TANC2 n=1 Tax=Gongylonema pulchrum TaxID=637853 RepID=A0A183DV03_9BILA|nr:unnamed protein product [Gongylonema pulchrum]